MTYKLDLPKGLEQQIVDGKIPQRELVRILREGVSQYARPGKVVDGAIDLQPADNGAYKYQRDWIPFFNKEGKAMIDPSDLYRAPDSVLPSLREDFKSYWLVTSGGLLLKADSLDGKIVHNKGSTVVKPRELQVLIPVYDNAPLDDVLKTNEGLQYNRALYDTQDDAKKITERLEHIAQKKSRDIRVWTPSQEGRKDRPERAVDFGYDDGRFLVCDWVDDNLDGRSRGVSVGKPAKQAARKIAA